jgi:hypothetical protein
MGLNENSVKHLYIVGEIVALASIEGLKPFQGRSAHVKVHASNATQRFSTAIKAQINLCGTIGRLDRIDSCALCVNLQGSSA